MASRGVEATAPVLLELQEITKRFPGVLANDRISLSVRAGEIHALVGENGAGKTTLMNILYGLYQPDGGRVVWRGRPVMIRDPGTALRPARTRSGAPRYEIRPPSICAHGVSAWGWAFPGPMMCRTSSPNAVRASATSERWQRHGTASAHMIAAGPSSRARVRNASSAAGNSGVSI